MRKRRGVEEGSKEGGGVGIRKQQHDKAEEEEEEVEDYENEEDEEE